MNMDFGLFAFLGFFAYSSLFISSRSDSLFVKLPILGLGVVAAAIMGTFSVLDENIVVQITSYEIQNFNQTSYFANGSINQIIVHNGTNTNPTDVLRLEQEWSVLFFTMFHFLLAFLNGFNALYVIAEKVNSRPNH